MIRAVTNTTLLSNFAHVREPHLPALAFPALAMPAAVREELAEGERLGLIPRLDWDSIPVVDIEAEEIAEIERLTPTIDRGETACIALAKRHRAVAVTDDQDARKVARLLNVKVSGTLGALILLVERRHVTLGEADELLARMVAAGYRSPSPSLAPYL